HVVPPIQHFVSSQSTNSIAPFLSWATAATNIQDAVDSASVAGATVLVSNGVYDVGGRVVSNSQTNRLVVTRPLSIRSLNGARFTTIRGSANAYSSGPQVRCVYLGADAMLTGFSIVDGVARDGQSGAG